MENTGSTLIAHVDTEKVDRQTLALMPTPIGTDTHKPIPHIEVVNALVETLGFRHIGVHREEIELDITSEQLGPVRNPANF